MTLIQACAVLLYIPFVYASLLRLNGTSIHTLDASDSPPSNSSRTSWDIIWSCGVTLFACAWTAIHPNIPGMDEGRVTIYPRRLFLMVMALIAPELIILWASLQFFSAIAIAKKFNAQLADAHDHINPARPADFEDWTITHGFFAWMGGFILYVDGQPRATLRPDELLNFVLQRSVDMPVIPKADIEDRSKGDMISKGIAILQLLWFVCQLAARHLQNLPISLLEIDTLAIVVLTCIAYLFWWWKPKDVGRPYIVHWKETELPPSSLTFTYESLAFDKEDSRFSHGGCFRYLFYLVYPWMSSAGMGAIMSPSAVHSRRVASLGGYGEPDDVITALNIIGGHVRRLHMRAATRLFRRNQIAPLIGGNASGASFWSQISDAWNLVWSTRLRPIVSGSEITALIGGHIGALMGGIHCLAWNFLFQKRTDQILWRVASLVVTYAPSQLLALILILPRMLEFLFTILGEMLARTRCWCS